MSKAKRVSDKVLLAWALNHAKYGESAKLLKTLKKSDKASYDMSMASLLKFYNKEVLGIEEVEKPQEKKIFTNREMKTQIQEVWKKRENLIGQATYNGELKAIVDSFSHVDEMIEVESKTHAIDIENKDEVAIAKYRIKKYPKLIADKKRLVKAFTVSDDKMTQSTLNKLQRYQRDVADMEAELESAQRILKEFNGFFGRMGAKLKLSIKAKFGKLEKLDNVREER